jgi:hypothetical protein
MKTGSLGNGIDDPGRNPEKAETTHYKISVCITLGVDLPPIFGIFAGSGGRILLEIRPARLWMSGAFLCGEKKPSTDEAGT